MLKIKKISKLHTRLIFKSGNGFVVQFIKNTERFYVGYYSDLDTAIIERNKYLTRHKDEFKNISYLLGDTNV